MTGADDTNTWQDCTSTRPHVVLAFRREAGGGGPAQTTAPWLCETSLPGSQTVGRRRDLSPITVPSSGLGYHIGSPAFKAAPAPQTDINSKQNPDLTHTLKLKTGDAFVALRWSKALR